MGDIKYVQKRDGTVVSFDKEKISQAIYKAAKAVGVEDKLRADELANAVTLFLKSEFKRNMPTIEEIQDIVEKVLIETGHMETAKAYIIYRQKRKEIREGVCKINGRKLVFWDQYAVSKILKEKTGLENNEINELCSEIEETLKQNSKEEVLR
jgi:anaerobic ribonucleoside-triphosphate reductase